MMQGERLQLPKELFRCQNQNEIDYHNISDAYEGTISYTSTCRCTHLPAHMPTSKI